MMAKANLFADHFVKRCQDDHFDHLQHQADETIIEAVDRLK